MSVLKITRTIPWCLCLILAACAAPRGGLSCARVAEIPAPSGFTRIRAAPDGFGAWLRTLPLKHNRTILLHTGEALTSHRYDVLAVIDKPLYFRDNIEECIDFCLRLWADFHRERGLLHRLYLFDLDGRRVFFSRADAAPAASGAYLEFLRQGLVWSNPWSVARGARPVTAAEIRPGDCIIQTAGRSRGQASLILDECVAARGERLFLIGFGFSPAQEFHIERAASGDGVAGWFSLDGYFHFLETRYPDYGTPALYRF